MKDRSLFSVVFRALIVLFSYGYNLEICKIIEATLPYVVKCKCQETTDNLK